jgi:hypothetical protein
MTVGEMYVHGWYKWDNIFMGGEIGFRDILAPTIATLSNDDQEFFAKGDQVSYFEDVIDLFQASSRILEEPAVIREQGEVS